MNAQEAFGREARNRVLRADILACGASGLKRYILQVMDEFWSKRGMMSKLSVLLLIAVFAASVAPAITWQQKVGPTKEELLKEIQNKSNAAHEKGNPLMELEYLRPLRANKDGQVVDTRRDPDVQSMAGLLLMNASAEIGNYLDALKYADALYGQSSIGKPPNVSRLEGYESVDALDAILRASDAAQIILINEAHHVPQHRAFTYELLKALRRKGFTHFAAETLSEEDTSLNERGYPKRMTGYYTNEPLYGELVRVALKLGYRVVPYEWTGEYTPDNREQGQAKNLVDRILKESPKARILVHAGYAHIEESGTLVGAKTMAQRLKEITGIDPFTIDQTEMTQRSSPEYEHPLYRYLTGKKLISRPTIYRNARGEWWALIKGKVDATLFHPRSVYRGGRPTWASLGTDRRPYRLPGNICGSAARCLVRARFEAESDDAVAVDQVEAITGQANAVLMLPAGEFVLEVKDAADRMLKTYRIKSP